MLTKEDLSLLELDLMRRKGIDIDLSLSILNDYNAGKIGRTPPVIPEGVPPIDGERILDLRNPEAFSFSASEIQQFNKRFPDLKLEYKEDSFDTDGISLTAGQLKDIGNRLFPRYSYGFLNGGSATSYADRKKNRGFNPALFELYGKAFDDMAVLAKGLPKGTTPAFIQPDGSAGPSYMELKLRGILLKSRMCSAKIPFFQMTSVSNDETVQTALKEYARSPWLQSLATDLNYPVWKNGLTGIQPLITAYTHSQEGSEKGLFRPETEGQSDFLALPGGHGQSFRVLKSIFEQLHSQGIRFISLGNIDNLGYTPDPLSLALLAIKGNPAGFDFSFKTPVDVKGGILIKDRDNSFNCVDLGVGISNEEASALEKKGEKILFNCATGLFDLTWLLKNIDRIIKNLPLRFSDQNKDAGLYSQAEQVTWEVIGMIDNPLIFGIDKFKRFLAAKILMENLLTSGLGLDNPAFPGGTESGSLRETGRKLHKGLEYLLTQEYGLYMDRGRWIPMENKQEG